MKFVIIFLLCVAIVGVYGVMSPLLNPDGPFPNEKLLYQAEFDELLDNYAEQI